MNGPYKALSFLAAAAMIAQTAQTAQARATLAQGARASMATDAVVGRSAISAVLDDSAAGWNTGDLDRFMASYEKSPRTTYVSGGKLVSGYDAIRTTYASRFAGGGAAMGRLTLAILDLRMIGPDHAYVVGRFRLHRADPAGDAEGLTTLLFTRTGAGWRIVADHS